MIFQSKTLINGAPAWVLDTDTQTVRHINLKTAKVERYVFHTEHIERHLHYVEEYHPERLQRLVDEGEIYKYLDELDIKITDALNAQTEKFMQSSKEYQIANAVSDHYKIERIGNNIRERAKECVFDAMVYV